MKVLLVVATLMCIGQYVADGARTNNRRQEEGMPPMFAEEGRPRLQVDDSILMELSRCEEFCRMDSNVDLEMCQMYMEFYMQYLQSEQPEMLEGALEICKSQILLETPESMLGRCDAFCREDRNVESEMCLMYREYQQADIPPEEVLEICKLILQEIPE